MNRPLSLEALGEAVAARAGAAVWLDDAGPVSWIEFGGKIEAARRLLAGSGARAGTVVVCPADAGIDSLAWLLGAAAAGAIAAPLRRERWSELEGWREIVPIGLHVRDGRVHRVGEGRLSPAAAPLVALLRESGRPGLILATGGTTGTPKLVLHDFNAVLAAVPMRPGRPWRTLPLMRFDHVGGLDVAWRCLAGGQILIAPPAELTPDRVAAVIERHNVEVMPATPSFLNLLLLSDSGSRHDFSSLRIVPYGAEPMPAGLLRRLRERWPQVDFVERFGTSETGALPARPSGGGLALPADSSGFEWKVVDRELWVRSPSCALGYLSGPAGAFERDGWFRTGDLAEALPDGSIRVLGRRENLINVGGEKVLPQEVEEALLSHPLVADCYVAAAPNAVLGQVVSADVVWRGPDRDAVAVKRELHTFAGARVARHKLPAIVRLVDHLEATANLKKRRAVPS